MGQFCPILQTMTASLMWTVCARRRCMKERTADKNDHDDASCYAAGDDPFGRRRSLGWGCEFQSIERDRAGGTKQTDAENGLTCAHGYGNRFALFLPRKASQMRS